MGDFADAFDSLYEAQSDALGKRLKILLNGKPHKVIPEPITLDMVPGHGGQSEAGGYKCTVKLDDFNGESPKKIVTQAVLYGQTLQILHTQIINETIDLWIGDVTEEDR